MIRALCGEHFEIKNLSPSGDTRLMQELLESESETLDAGDAGTTFRFLTAWLATQEGSRILTGSNRMQQRPIGPLAEALKKLGAEVEYLGKNNYPPLRISRTKNLGHTDALSIPANISSQYISALLMIAPSLPRGLNLKLEGRPVSAPYFEMTLQMMEYFGVEHSWQGDTIRVAAQKYRARPFVVAADWSAASYYYAMAAFSEKCDLKLYGLSDRSRQGDSVLAQMMEQFGVKTSFRNGYAHLKKTAKAKSSFEWDFLPCPDLAQTLAVVCGGLGVAGLFAGLDTLRIKETDRIAALQTELAKIQVSLSKLSLNLFKKIDGESYGIEGKATFNGLPIFDTYRDHRMAMAFAPLAMLGAVKIKQPEVVEKSYPNFWEDLRQLGFVILA